MYFLGFSRIFLLGILIFKGLTARRLYKSLGVKGLNNRMVGQQSWPELEYRKICCLCRESKKRYSVVQHVVQSLHQLCSTALLQYLLTPSSVVRLSMCYYMADVANKILE
jgi:hypothetical protein